jgi:hypothetical protein
LVERGPEKAGVGGSIPSLATNSFNNLAVAKTVKKFHRAHNTRTSVCVTFTFGVARSNNFDISRAVLLVGNVLLRQHRIAFRHLDIRVAPGSLPARKDHLSPSVPRCKSVPQIVEA